MIIWNIITMERFSRVSLVLGILVLSLTIVNGFTADIVTPSLQRAEVLAVFSSIGLLLISILLKEVIPVLAQRVQLVGEQVFYINDELSKEVRTELAWGSHQILTNTAACTILVWYKKKTILKRGIHINKDFIPGDICLRCRKRLELTYLAKTKLYPGRYEFDNICPNLPALIIYPLGHEGFVIIGGNSERCFNKSDEYWIKGWSERLLECTSSVN